MAAPAFSIEETTGRQRRVSLRGRSLPHRGVAWSGRQRSVMTTYPGNPVSTLQVLGPEQEPTQLGGRWSDRFLGSGQVAIVEGFEPIIRAEDLVRVFESLRDSGNLLRVQWGPQVRFGILSVFTATYERQEDVAWSAEFTWVGRQETARRAVTSAEPIGQLRQRMNEFDDGLALMPGGLSPDYVASVTSGVRTLRARVAGAFDHVRVIAQAPQAPIRMIRGLAADAIGVRDEMKSVLAQLADQPLELGLPAGDGDRVATQIRVQSWRRTQARRGHRLQAETIREAQRQERKANPRPRQHLVAAEGENLRHLAVRFYGSADAWTKIARANGLASSSVPAGTLLLIPPAGPTAETC